MLDEPERGAGFRGARIELQRRARFRLRADQALSGRAQPEVRGQRPGGGQPGSHGGHLRGGHGQPVEQIQRAAEMVRAGEVGGTLDATLDHVQEQHLLVA